MTVFIPATRSAPTKSSQTLPHLPGRGLASGQRDLLLLSLQREADTEPGLPGDHSGSSRRLSLWGLMMGYLVQAGGRISKSPPEQRSLEDGGLALDTSCLRVRKSRSLVHQACCRSPPRGERTWVPLAIHWGPGRGFSARHSSPWPQASRRLYSARAEDFFTPSQIRAA